MTSIDRQSHDWFNIQRSQAGDAWSLNADLLGKCYEQLIQLLQLSQLLYHFPFYRLVGIGSPSTRSGSLGVIYFSLVY